MADTGPPPNEGQASDEPAMEAVIRQIAKKHSRTVLRPLRIDRPLSEISDELSGPGAKAILTQGDSKGNDVELEVFRSREDPNTFELSGWHDDGGLEPLGVIIWTSLGTPFAPAVGEYPTYLSDSEDGQVDEFKEMMLAGSLGTGESDSERDAGDQAEDAGELQTEDPTDTEKDRIDELLKEITPARSFRANNQDVNDDQVDEFEEMMLAGALGTGESNSERDAGDQAEGAGELQTEDPADIEKDRIDELFKEIAPAGTFRANNEDFNQVKNTEDPVLLASAKSENARWRVYNDQPNAFYVEVSSPDDLEPPVALLAVDGVRCPIELRREGNGQYRGVVRINADRLTTDTRVSLEPFSLIDVTGFSPHHVRILLRISDHAASVLNETKNGRLTFSIKTICIDDAAYSAGVEFGIEFATQSGRGE